MTRPPKSRQPSLLFQSRPSGGLAIDLVTWLLTRKLIELWACKLLEHLLSVTSWIGIFSSTMSNSIPSLATSKTSNPPSQTPSPSQSQSGSFAGFDNHPQRRSGGLGSFGAGSNSRNPSTPRNNQPLRKQHKGQRRPRLADEDALAESVGGPPGAWSLTGGDCRND